MTPDFTATIETMFRDGMSAEYGLTLPLYYSNTYVPDSVDRFAVVHVISSDLVSPIHLGGEAKSRNVGVIQIDVFTPKDSGAGEGKRIAQFAGRLFKRKSFHVGADNGHAVLKDFSIQDRGEVWGRHKEQVSLGYRFDFDQ